MEYQKISTDLEKNALNEVDDDIEADEIVEIHLANHDFDNKKGEEKDVEITLCQAAFTIFQRAFPLTLTFALTNMTNFIMLYFAGHLHTSENQTDIFAGVSMSILFTNITCLSILVGMTGAVETLGSQNYGAKNYHEVGIVLQRSILILSLLVIPVVLSWLYVEDIFLQLGVSAEICVVMKHFLRIRALAIPSELMSQSYQKYLMSIGVASPCLAGTIALIIFVFVFNYIFVHHFHGGYTSIAWGFVFAKYLSDISIVLFSLKEKPVQLTLQPFHWSAFSNWWEFIQLGIPGCAMLCSEWWAFEILCIFASRLGSNEVAAQTIIGQMSALAFMIPLGVGVAISSFVGQYIGSLETHLAKKFALTAFLSLLCAELIISPSVFFFSPSFVGILTSDPKVIDICVRVSHIIAIFTFADGTQGVLSGIFRGAGKQLYGAVINFLSYYCLGLPLAWHLTFNTSMGVAGLMTGISASVVTQVIVFLSILYFQQDSIFSSVVHQHSDEIKHIELSQWDEEMDESSHNMIYKKKIHQNGNGNGTANDDDEDDEEDEGVR